MWVEEHVFNYLILEGDQKLSQIVVKLCPFLEVSAQLEERVVGRGQLLQHVLSAKKDKLSQAKLT